MDPSATQTALGVDMGVVRGAITALTMAVYVGIFWWAYRSGNRERFEADARLPFEDGDDSQGAGGGDAS